MQRFTPSLFERLFDEPAASGADPLLRGLTIEQVKASVARDLEALLNSRMGMMGDLTAGYPYARSSVLTFGLRDFAGMSFESPGDRRSICEAIGQTVERHEPRLRGVTVDLIDPDRHVPLLNFSVKAMLMLAPACEPVSFDAFLQPMTHQYDVALSRR